MRARRREVGTDVALVAGIWVFSGLLNGSEPWGSFDTPDSEFHASMSIYTDEVTSRSDQPVYYWTRIGHIAPAHLLTEALGPLPGLEAYRLVLLAIMVVAVYATLRRVTGRLNATVLALLVTSSTVLLGYLGNPYPTATAMAGIFALIAVGVLGRGWRAHVLAGGILGWLVMTSPFGTLLGLVAYLSTLAGRGPRRLHVRQVLAWAGALIGGAAVVFGALWVIGRLLFPGLDWVSTYLYWNSALSQADYITDRMRWTWDPSLLVVAMAAAIAVVTLLTRSRGVATRTAAALALATPIFALIHWWLLPSNYLEIPHYQAMLFPAALMAMALAAASRLPDVPVTWARGLIAAAVVGLSVLAGHVALDLSVTQSRLLAVVLVVVFVVPTATRWGLALAVVGVTFAGAQVLQNARDTFGVSTSEMYVNAYAENEAADMMAAAVAAQDWVVSRTSPGDRVLTWVDADWDAGEQDLLPLAAFQLWGANEAARGPVASPDAIASMEARKPLAIVMYGRSIDAVLEFWNSLPATWRASTPECTKVPWPDTGSAQICITRPSW